MQVMSLSCGSESGFLTSCQMVLVLLAQTTLGTAALGHFSVFSQLHPSAASDTADHLFLLKCSS